MSKTVYWLYIFKANIVQFSFISMTFINSFGLKFEKNVNKDVNVNVTQV